MKKNSKRTLLFTSIMLAALLTSSAYASLTPNVNAAEPPIQGNLSVSLPEVNVTKSAIEEKGLPILSNVLSLDIARYATASKEGPQSLYMDVVPEENVRYTLQSDDSKVDMLCTFVNGNLRMINVLESEGTVHLTKLATKPLDLGNVTLQVIDLVGTAKGFLSDYQSFSGKAFYGELSRILENVDADKNVTKTVGNVKFEVTVSEGSTVFKWTYTFNGIEAPDKCVAIGYQNGFLKYFLDNWDLYKIGSTSVNLSEKEAIDIAMERARAFSWNMSADNDTVKIANFKVTNAMIWENVFASNLYADEARSDDPLMLYPVRHVWVSLDKYYPGNVYGIEVYIWADTKDVAHIQERFSTLDPPVDLVATSDDYTVQPLSGQSVNEVESNDLLITWVTFPAFAGIMIGIIPVWLLLSKKKNLPKSFCKIGGILLCVLVFSTIALVPISVASAEDTRGALIFGSRSDGAMTDPPNSYHWRKTANELTRQGITSNAISNYFRDDGYATENHQGNPGSLHDNVLNEIDVTADQHSLVAIVDFDHGVGNIREGEFHFMFEDNKGTYVGPPPYSTYPPIQYPNEPWNGVYDYEIRQRTDDYNPSKYFFSFINTCMSANTTNPYTGQEWQGPGTGNARSMPYAFTGRRVTPQPTSSPPSGYMSRNGYTNPDSDQFAYMGFPFGSAALSQTITGISPLYATWLENFFWYALSFDISVNDALDEATLSNFNCLFGSSDLATGFTANWPQDSNGDGIWEDNYGYGSTLVLYGNGNIHLYQYFVHDYVDATWYGYYAGVDNPDGIEGGKNDGSYACLYAVGWYGDQAVITGSIGWEAKGHIYLYGNTYSGYNSHVLVYVSYDYSNWYPVNTNLWISQSSPSWIDVGSYSNNFRYIAVVVYADYAPSVLYVDSVLVIPSLSQSSSHYWVSSITDYSWYGSSAGVGSPENLIGSSNDGQYGYVYAGNYGDQAVIVGAMNADAHGHIELYGYSAPGYYSHLYVYVSYDYSNWYQVTSQTVNPGSAHWIDCGSYTGNFRYIAIVAYNDQGLSGRIYVDSVKVTP